MSGLTFKDLEILGFYAEQGNRVLYWNYLASRNGVDAYPALALSVVRNDNMPGSIANHYAANKAITVNGKPLNERQWEALGTDLMRNDFELRKNHLQGSNPEQALNLSAAAVEAVHDKTFKQWGITPNAWTPKHMFESIRTNDGNQAVQDYWEVLLDNSQRGGKRFIQTLGELTGASISDGLSGNMKGVAQNANYLADTSNAYMAALNDSSYENPNKIKGYHYDGKDGWGQLSGGKFPRWRPLTDPALVQELNDARQVRLERLEMYQESSGQRNPNRHPDDRTPLLKSKFYFSDAQDHLPPQPIFASLGAEPAQAGTTLERSRINKLFTAAAMGEDALRSATSAFYDSDAGQRINAKAFATIETQERQEQQLKEAQVASLEASPSTVKTTETPMVRSRT